MRLHLLAVALAACAVVALDAAPTYAFDDFSDSASFDEAEFELGVLEIELRAFDLDSLRATTVAATVEQPADDYIESADASPPVAGIIDSGRDRQLTDGSSGLLADGLTRRNLSDHNHTSGWAALERYEAESHSSSASSARGFSTYGPALVQRE